MCSLFFDLRIFLIIFLWRAKLLFINEVAEFRLHFVVELVLLVHRYFVVAAFFDPLVEVVPAAASLLVNFAKLHDFSDHLVVLQAVVLARRSCLEVTLDLLFQTLAHAFGPYKDGAAELIFCPIDFQEVFVWFFVLLVQILDERHWQILEENGVAQGREPFCSLVQLVIEKGEKLRVFFHFVVVFLSLRVVLVFLNHFKVVFVEFRQLDLFVEVNAHLLEF